MKASCSYTFIPLVLFIFNSILVHCSTCHGLQKIRFFCATKENTITLNNYSKFFVHRVLSLIMFCFLKVLLQISLFKTFNTLSFVRKSDDLLNRKTPAQLGNVYKVIVIQNDNFSKEQKNIINLYITDDFNR